MPKLAPKTQPNEPTESLREKILKPYLFHGVEIHDDGQSENVPGDCPFCGKENKFSVNATTGLSKCWVCGVGSDKGGMNPLGFVRALWDASDKATTDYSELVANRGFLDADAPMQWGAAQSIVDRAWMLPGRDAKGNICQVYRWVGMPKRTMYPTPGLGHGMFWAAPPDKQTAWITEGFWDGGAAWELLRQIKQTGSGLQITASEQSSLLADTSIVGIPGCNSFKQEWASLFDGKDVVLPFDNDHPKLRCKACKKSYSKIMHSFCPKCRGSLEGPEIPPAGYMGVKRVAGMLAGHAKSIRFVKWGASGYDPNLPCGSDLRDVLCAGKTLAERVPLLGQLLAKIQPIPDDWGITAPINGHSHSKDIEALPCTSWAECYAAWKEAMELRQSLEDALSVGLAVCLSTNQKGESQLFLQIIGDAGGGKTRFLDGMRVSRTTYLLEHLTGFHSGWKDGSGNDFSLIARINGKTLITPEGDVMMSNPKAAELMSQQRRIFDGSSKAEYKNKTEEENKEHTGLRTPWIIGGTPALLSFNQSRVGDRFLKVILDHPDEKGKQAILRKVALRAIDSVMQSSNGTAGSILSKEMLFAYQMTGGYVDYLRENSDTLLQRVEIPDREMFAWRCGQMADLVSHLRARPDMTKADEKHETKEMPTRLTEQFIRLACCLAVVLGRFRIDAEVMRRVRKVAMDTASGKTLDWLRQFRAKDAEDVAKGQEESGCGSAQLAIVMHEEENHVKRYLKFLKKIKVVENFKSTQSARETRWRLTPKMKELWKEVVGDA